MFMPAIRATYVFLFITRVLTLALLVPCVSADHPDNTVAANDFAVSADLFD
jgi:hypothetical protein